MNRQKEGQTAGKRTGWLKAGRKVLQIWEFLKIRWARIKYGSLDPAHDIKELNLFERSNPADLVYCEMPMSDFDLAAVPDGHRCRPYLVIEKREDGIIGIPGSHKYSRNGKWRQFELDAKEYREFLFFGDSRYNASQTILDCSHPVFIPKEKMLSRSIHLIADDIARINRLLRMIYGRKLISKPYQIEGTAIKTREGDILCVQGQEMLVLERYGNEAVCLPVIAAPKDPDGKALVLETIDHRKLSPASLSSTVVSDPDQHPFLAFCHGQDLIEFEQKLQQERRDQKEKQSKKSRKPVFTLRKMHLKYPPGSVFTDFYSGDEWVYFWSKNDVDYYQNMETYYNGIIQVQKGSGHQLEEVYEQIDPETMKEILEALTGPQISQKEADYLLHCYENPDLIDNSKDELF